MSEGVKYDKEKARLDLVPPLIELDVGYALGFGASKYSEDNWRKVPDLQKRYIAAAMRHINAIKQGEIYDPESKNTHAAHAICCLMFLGEIQLEEAKARSSETSS